MSQQRTTTKKRLFLEILEHSSGRISNAIQDSGISWATFYNWMKGDPIFNKKVEETLSIRATSIRDVLMTKALEGNIGALKYLDAKLNKESITPKTEIHMYHHTDKEEEKEPYPRTLADLIRSAEENRVTREKKSSENV